MPNRKTHNLFAALLGIDPKLANGVNGDMDRPAKFLGPAHRSVNHDLAFAVREAVKYGTPEAAVAVQAHIALDALTDNEQARRFFRLLEALQ